MNLVSLISRLFSAWSEQMNTLKSESDHIISQPEIHQRPPVAHEMKPKLGNVAEKNIHCFFFFFFFPWFLKPYPYFSSLSKFLYFMSLCLGILEKAIFSSRNVFLLFPYIPAHIWHSSILS